MHRGVAVRMEARVAAVAEGVKVAAALAKVPVADIVPGSPSP